ncbi:MFS transporter [Rasamsonia emersonii CBS 393.64]|uniref:MFS transporter n=1 Tax=Rasamsonia emersonii (strain ATCC 16479 / CBS 393.64 / IMI 116815) TaxID=1408163 RepID=A0A0F4Z563_RASE3|nr:MFS transporter [Rasamsonia emersonii CBS 393.64]KKA25033.1 MFS transporter [Rasamsonia emersonii CBS 393.64]
MSSIRDATGPSTTATSVIELQSPLRSERQYSIGNNHNNEEDHDETGQTFDSPEEPPTGAVVHALEKWNAPSRNIPRTLATFWSFLIMGANDAAYGLESYYNLSYTVVSLVFLSPLVGYASAALLNNVIHMHFGQRGIAWLSPGFHVVSYIINAVHPPYPVLVVSFIFAGIGNGLADSAWNAWIANLANANELLGFLHGFYGIGGSAIELGASIASFWKANGLEFRTNNARSADRNKESHMKEALFSRAASRVTWLCAAFLLGYVGVEVALGGWIVTFMIRVREGAPFASGITATGFWVGVTVGRVVLGFITPRIGERLAIAIYLPLAMALELIFWLVPQFYVSAVAIALQGFFLGPMFPAAVVAATKLLPRHLHVSSIGFAAALGGAGAAVFPFAVGALAQAKGVQVLQPFILALLGAILCVWLGLPHMSNNSTSIFHRDNLQVNSQHISPHLPACLPVCLFVVCDDQNLGPDRSEAPSKIIQIIQVVSVSVSRESGQSLPRPLPPPAKST